MLAGNCSTLVSIWGAPAGSPLNTPTRQFLLLRGLAAPVTVLLLVMQVSNAFFGVFIAQNQVSGQQ